MSKALIILGVIVLVMGVFLSTYEETSWHDMPLFGQTSVTATPYKDLGIALIIGGCSIIAGGAIIKKSKT